MNRSRASCVGDAMRILFAAITLVPAIASAAPYDKLFELGLTMTYDETRSVTFGVFDNADKKTETKRTTCTVAKLEKIKGARVSTIECDQGSSMGSQWLSTNAGLWRMSGADIDDVKRVMRRPVFLPARPRARVRDNTTKEGMGDRSVITKKNDRWCVEESSADPNGEGSTTTCFANGLIVEETGGGTWYGEGGGESSTSAVLVTQSLPKPTVSPTPPLKKTSP